MLERTTRSYIDSILSKDFTRLEGRDASDLDARRAPRKRSPSARSQDGDEEESRRSNMTRRTRRPRIPTLQSGYCAVCSVPYNSVQDHIQSKKHQKLIGEDANYIALNGSLNGFLQNDSIPFLNLNGVDAIGVHDSSFDEFSPKYKKRAMPRTRACSVMSDRVKSAPLSPGSDTAGHHLRSRKNINYMSPPSDDDSLQEKPDHSVPDEPANREYKEYRELRSSTKALAKLTEQVMPSTDQEVWNSGRPKRACINKKRPSTEDCATPNSKTFYKVEVVSSKVCQKGHRDTAKRQQSQSPRRDEDKEKALIVKFRKMRNSELVRLNNEATNFLFPQKEDSGSENEEEEAENASECDESTRMSCSDVGDCNESSRSFKVEDDRSMDSSSSSSKGKKKRRTHAEAFIMDNQKYYKFETPGSRLRYHGSYLPAVPKSPKFNGAFSAKPEDPTPEESTPEEPTPEEPNEKKIKYNPDAKVKLENYKFSFEKVPTLAPWYEPFRRIDKGEQAYIEFSDYFLDPFLLPYQMPAIPPLDPRVCLSHYSELRKRITAPPQKPTQPEANSRSPTPEGSASASPPSSFVPDQDDDSKLSVATASSMSSAEDEHRAGNKNPRKSPRQHASTLAILGGLIHPRRKRAKKAAEPGPSLAAIPEESVEGATEPQAVEEKPKTPARKTKPRVDYCAIARQIDKELDNALDDGLENYDLDVPTEHTVDFVHSKCSLAEIMRLYDEDRSKENGNGCRRFLNGVPGRKPGRRKKTNRTGWPSKNRRSLKREPGGGGKEGKDENNTEESDDSDEDDEPVSVETAAKEEEAPSPLEEEEEDSDREGKVTNGELRFQPYVCVQKLDSRDVVRESDAPKRTKRRLRHMPGSPKSPRMLRKPRGRWYRER